MWPARSVGSTAPSVFPTQELQVALLVDDMIDTGKTLSLAARTLYDKGAAMVYALISHGEIHF